MKRKIWSFLLIVCLAVSLLPAGAWAAEINTSTDTGKAIQLVDNGTAANISGGQKSSVYFGTYQQASLGDIEPTTGTENVDWIKSDTAINKDQGPYYSKDPIKWRVLANDENDNGNLFLLSDQNLDVFAYHKENENVTWAKSTIRSWLNGYGTSENTGGESGIDYTGNNFLDHAFSVKEQTAIADTTVADGDNGSIEGGNNTIDQIFLLSTGEAKNQAYFGEDTNSAGKNPQCVATNTAYVTGGGEIGINGMHGVGVADAWWLRSLVADGKNAEFVNTEGRVLSNSVKNSYTAVRPAFHLDLRSVLFTSAAKDGKSANGMDAGLVEVSEDSESEWKLTLLERDRKFAIDAQKETIKAGNKIYVPYSSAKTGEKEYISAMITTQVDGTEAATHYGRVKKLKGDSAANGEAEITLPDGFDASNSKLYLFNEQYNGEWKTDYASALNKVTIPQQEENVFAVTNSLTGLTSDGTGYVKKETSGSGAAEDYTATLSAEEAYLLPETITVDVGGTSLSVGDDTYTYDTATGKLTIKKTAITGNITIIAKGRPCEATPKVEIDHAAETLTGFTANASYEIKIGEGEAQTVTPGADGTIDIADTWFGQTLSIVKKGSQNSQTSGAIADSKPQQLTIPARPKAPNVTGVPETVQGKNDGKLTGTTAEMEYRKQEASVQGNWTACTAPETTGLAPGIYEVRTKAVTDGTNKAFASSIKEVTIAQGEAPTHTISVAPINFDTLEPGYTQPAAKPITIKNTGNSDVIITTVALDAAGQEKFDLTEGSTNSTITPGNSDTSRSIRPKADLGEGTHTGTITVTYSDGNASGGNTSGRNDPGKTATADVTFTVAHPYTPPYIPPDDITSSGDTTTIEVTPTVTDGIAKGSISQSKGEMLVAKAVSNGSEVIFIDMTTWNDRATEGAELELPAGVIEGIGEIEQSDETVGAKFTIESDAGEMTLDQKVLKAISETAKAETEATGKENPTVTISIHKIKETPGRVEFELKIKVGDRYVSDFAGGSVTVTVPLKENLRPKTLTCAYIRDDGTYSKLGGQKSEDQTAFTFETSHFSTFAILEEAEADHYIEKDKVETTEPTLTTEAKPGKITVSWSSSAERQVDCWELYRAEQQGTAESEDGDNAIADSETADAEREFADNKAAVNESADAGNKTADNEAADPKNKAADNRTADAGNKARVNKVADPDNEIADWGEPIFRSENGTAASYEDADPALKEGKTYAYKIRGVKTLSKGTDREETVYTKWSNISEVTARESYSEYLKRGVEGTTLQADSAAAKDHKSVKITWKKSAGFKMDSYEVFKSTKKTTGYGSKAYFTKKAGNMLTGTYKNTKELKRGQAYYYKVRGVRIIDGKKVYTKWSNSTKAIVDQNRYLINGVQATTIKAGTAANKDPRYIKVSWKKAEGFKVDAYEIYRSTAKNSGYGTKPYFKKAAGSSLNGWYKNTKDLKKGKTYYYKVRGVRIIDGKKICTKWSNIADRIAV